MPYVLDTDIISALQRGHSTVVAHVKAVPATELFVTIVSFQEQVTGRLSRLNRAAVALSLIAEYRNLYATLDFYISAYVLPYDEVAAREDEHLRGQLRRMGTQDRRIAAIARAQDLILVTGNILDYRNVRGLVLENWLIP